MTITAGIDVGGSYTKVVLLECKVCKNALTGISEIVQTGADTWEWESAARVWPAPPSSAG